jgi:hypothetical protein
MHTIQVLELSRAIHSERLAEAERIRHYRRLREQQRQTAQPRITVPRVRRPLMARLHVWRTA